MDRDLISIQISLLPLMYIPTGSMHATLSLRTPQTVQPRAAPTHILLPMLHAHSPDAVSKKKLWATTLSKTMRAMARRIMEKSRKGRRIGYNCGQKSNHHSLQKWKGVKVSRALRWLREQGHYMDTLGNIGASIAGVLQASGVNENCYDNRTGLWPNQFPPWIFRRVFGFLHQVKRDGSLDMPKSIVYRSGHRSLQVRAQCSCKMGILAKG